MKKLSGTLLTAWLAGAALAGSNGWAQVVRPVPGTYATIQEALDAAVDGDTVRVARGTRPDSFTLKAGVVVQGEEAAETILTGTVNGAAGTLEHFTLRGVTWRFTRASGLVFRHCIVRDSAGTALTIENSTGTQIVHNVFTANQTALRFSNADGVFSTGSVLANAFVGNGTALAAPMPLVTREYNLFSGNTADGDPGDTAILAAPGFVDAAAGDFHLLAGSACIDAVPGAARADPDGTAADCGVYGGPTQDPAPRRVTGVTVAAGTAADAVTLAWATDSNYLVTGYRLHYGTASGVYTGTGAAEGDSPVTVSGRATASAALSHLVVSTNPPPAPAGLTASPGDQSLLLTWSAAAGATGYTVLYGTASGAYTRELDAGANTAVSLGGLANGQTHYLAVRPYTATTYTFAVSALGAPPADSETPTPAGRLSAEQSLTLHKTEGALSAEVAEAPGSISGNPILADNGACFLGTLSGPRLASPPAGGLGALLLAPALLALRRRPLLPLLLAALVAAAGSARADDARGWSLDARAGGFWPAAAWNDRYEHSVVPDFKLGAGYHLARWLECGAEAGYRRAEGTVRTTDDGRPLARALDQTLTVVPLGVYALVRWQTAEHPLLVPYLAAGLTRALYRHQVDGGRSARGHQDGYHARAGLALSLRPFDPRATARSQREYGLREAALTLEAQYARLDDFGAADDLGGWTLFAGLGLGF